MPPIINEQTDELKARRQRRKRRQEPPAVNGGAPAGGQSAGAARDLLRGLITDGAPRIEEGSAASGPGSESKPAVSASGEREDRTASESAPTTSRGGEAIDELIRRVKDNAAGAAVEASSTLEQRRPKGTTVRRHGKRVKIKTHARSKLERVQRCHPRTVRRRTVVFVRARRHGHLVKIKRVKYVRVVVPPRLVAKAARAVPFGHGTTVDGWLGTSSGTALAGQVVHVLTAPNNGSNAFTEAATVTTTATGVWTAQLPAGPSRVVEAVFDGSPTTESSSSRQVRVVVPAMVRIAIQPRIVPWGSEIHVTGRVLGGYVPTNSNLLRLDVGVGRLGHIEGLPQILPNGRFLIVWKFDRGQGVIHPWFSVSTLSEAAFPYAPGRSKRVIITLGERTPVAAKHHKSRRRRGSHDKTRRKKR